MRKFQAAAAIVALAAGSMSGTASADDEVKYKDLIHCAAVNMVVASGLSGLDKAKFKDAIKLLISQATALILMASVNEDPAAHEDEASKQATMIMTELSGKAKDEAKSQAFFGSEVPRCVSMGQAANKEITDSPTGK